MLISCFLRIHIETDTGSPPEEGAGKNNPEENGAQNQHARQAERPDEEIRQPGRIAFGRVSDVHDDWG